MEIFYYETKPHCHGTKKRKALPARLLEGLPLENKMAATYSPACAVPSARSGLTSLFGMGRGGTPTL